MTTNKWQVEAYALRDEAGDLCARVWGSWRWDAWAREDLGSGRAPTAEAAQAAAVQWLEAHGRPALAEEVSR